MESIYCLTQLCGGEIYIILLLHREQLHVSAFDNGHLQVVHESLNKQLYKHIYIYMGYLYGEGVKWARDLVSVRTVGTCGMHGGFMLLSSYV